MTPAFDEQLVVGNSMEIDEHAESKAKNAARLFQTNTAIKSEHLIPCMSEVVDSDEEFSSNYI